MDSLLQSVQAKVQICSTKFRYRNLYCPLSCSSNNQGGCTATRRKKHLNIYFRHGIKHFKYHYVSSSGNTMTVVLLFGTHSISHKTNDEDGRAAKCEGRRIKKRSRKATEEGLALSQVDTSHTWLTNSPEEEERSFLGLQEKLSAPGSWDRSYLWTWAPGGGITNLTGPSHTLGTNFRGLRLSLGRLPGGFSAWDLISGDVGNRLLPALRGQLFCWQ